MKRVSWRKVLLTFGVSSLLVYMIYAFVSGSDKDEHMICKDITVRILNINDAGFVTAADVHSIVEESKMTGKGKRLNDSIAVEVRKMLETKSYLKNVKVYPSGDGVLHISLEQRIPVVRLVTPSGSSYLDSEGYAFPTSINYVHDIPPATGNMPLPYKLPYKGPLPDKGSDFVRRLLAFAEYVGEDKFWNVQVQQINADGEGNVELVMCMGDEIVKMGQLDGYKYKLDKLSTFYDKVYPYLERNKYKTFDLRFGNQVVATRK